MPGTRRRWGFFMGGLVLAAGLAGYPACGSEWRYAAPPIAERRTDVDADWRPFEAIELALRSPDVRAGQTLKLIFFFQTKTDLWFESSRGLSLDGREHVFRWRLDDDSPDWRCSNARRPFGRDALRWVRAWGIQVFSIGPVSGTLDVGELKLLRVAGRPNPALIDIRAPGAAVAGTACSVAFRLAGFDGNPYSPADARAALKFKGPSGRGETPFYFRQDYATIRHPGLQEAQTVPLGLPVWQADWQPSDPGTYELLIEARVAGRRITRQLDRVDVAAGEDGAETPAGGTTDSGRETVFLATNALPELFSWDGHQWTRAATNAGSAGCWAVPLDWTPRWGHYTGLGEFDQRVAWGFEQRLKSVPAEAARPLLVFSRDELDDSGVLNWIDNPLNRKNGGPAAQPTAVFAGDPLRETVEARARYLWARFGRRPGVAGLLVLLDWQENEPVAWLRDVTEEIGKDIPAGALLCSNPDLPERINAKPLELVRDWLQDPRLAVGTVFRRDFGGQAIEMESSRGGSMAIVARRELHWAGSGAFSCEVSGTDSGWLPDVATCFIRTSPDTVFESIPIALHPEARTRLTFRTDSPGQWICPTAPGRVLLPYDLLNVQELGLRFFSSRKGPMAARLSRCMLQGPYRMDADMLRPLAVRNARLSRSPVSLNGRIEVSFDLSRVYSNPFDPAEVDVWGILTGPDGAMVKVPGFYFQDYSRSLVEGREVLSPQGGGCWKVRFCATAVGRYGCRIEVRDAQGGVASHDAGFVEVAPSPQKGFIRINRKDPRYLERGAGSFFFPIGHNICHPVDPQEPYPYKFPKPVNQQTYTFDRYLARMSESGENWGRVWLVPWGLGIEGSADWGEFHGVGRYSMENAWRLDHVLETAAEKGVALNLTIDHYSEFKQSWSYNPYNRALGGPLAQAVDFFWDSRAQDFYRRRLRYLVARWGYSPNIMAWELWGEVNLTPEYERRPAHVARWHRDTARFIQALDPWKHLVFTHCHNWQRGQYLWALPEIQCVQGNGYIRPPNNSVSHVVNFRGYINEVAAYRKPVFVAEYGGKSEQGAISADYLEAQLHSGLWSSLMYPFAGAAMHWWWNFIDGENMYNHYRGFSAFCSGIDKAAANYQTVEPIVNAPAGRRLNAIGMSSGRNSFLWVYHPDIFSRYQDLPAIEGATLQMPDLKPGTYRVEFWDTVRGSILGRETWTPAGRDALPLPVVTRDLAIRVQPEE